MKYQEFKNRISKFPVFSTSILGRLSSSEQVLRNQLSRWKKQGLVLELKRELYVLNENDRKITPSRSFLANQLYPPSYISTEYALMLYDLIPERVADVTSITTRKTAAFSNVFGSFIYQHLKTRCFEGFIEQKDENDYSFLIATPEKAIVDFVYLNLYRFERGKPDVFEQSFRFQNLTQLNVSRMLEFSCSFGSKKLLDVVEMLNQFAQETK